MDNENIAKVFQSAIKCTGKYGVDLTILQRLQSKESKRDDKFLTMLFCGLDDLKVVKKDGHFIEDEAVKLVSKGQRNDLRKVLEECNKEVGTDHIDVLYNVSKCLKEKNGVTVKI